MTSTSLEGIISSEKESYQVREIYVKRMRYYKKFDDVFLSGFTSLIANREKEIFFGIGDRDVA